MTPVVYLLKPYLLLVCPGVYFSPCAIFSRVSYVSCLRAVFCLPRCTRIHVSDPCLQPCLVSPCGVSAVPCYFVQCLRLSLYRLPVSTAVSVWAVGVCGLLCPDCLCLRPPLSGLSVSAVSSVRTVGVCSCLCSDVYVCGRLSPGYR